jgi:hypothetical protein
MSRFGLVGPSYALQTPNADCQTCMNLYTELNELGAGNAPIILLSTPGIQRLMTLSDGPNRGSITITGRTFKVSGASLFEIYSNNTFKNWGPVSNDGLMTTMAASPQQLLIASGGVAYIFNLTANTLTPIAGATFSGPVSQVGICDGFFLASIKNSKEFYVSGPLNAADWITNGAAIVSVFPDNIVSMTVVHREIFFTSDTKSVWYYDSGALFPFDVVQGSDMDQGCAATSGTSLLDNTVFWISSDERGHGKFFRANGYVPQRVSTHAVETAIQSYARLDDVVTFSYQDQGHDFLVAYFPTPSVTWVYDVTTNMWHQRGYFDNQSATFKAAHYQCHTFNFGKHLVGDWSSANVYQMQIPTQNQDGSWIFATDDGNLIHRLRRAPHISNEQKRQSHSELQLYLETGLGPVPPLPGPTPLINFLMQDPAGNIWALGVSNIGVLTTAPSIGMGQVLLLNGTDNNTSWLITISSVGVLVATKTTFNPYYPQSLMLSSPNGSAYWNLQISNIGVLQTFITSTMSRDPKISLRWSNDSAHTWSSYHDRSVGQAGEYKKRMRWNRLGSPRDRVYEISFAEPIGLRIVDAYLESAMGAGS